MEWETQFFNSFDGARIAYTVLGDGSPLVLAPDWSYNMEILRHGTVFREVWEGLAQSRKLIITDARGVGSSQRDVEVIDLEHNVRDLEALVDHMSLTRFELLGTFVGAAVAVAYAAQYPGRVSRLVLTRPYVRGMDLTPPEAARALMDLVKGNWVLASRWMVNAGAPRLPDDAQKKLARQFRDTVSAEIAAQYVDVQSSLDIGPLLPKIQSPTLVMFDRDSVIVPAKASRAVAARIPNATLVGMERSSISMDDDAEYVNAHLKVYRDFLGIEGRALGPDTVDQPSGTAIILFADIADSTALTERLGDAAFREKARDVAAALRSIIAEGGGKTIEGPTLGDGVLAVFTSARQAIEAALRCAKAGEDAGLPLHLGLHAGDVTREKDPDGRDNVYGGAVNIASRISALSVPGEVLVSQTVRDLARTSAGVGFEDRGEQALKGVGEPVRVWAVAEAG